MINNPPNIISTELLMFLYSQKNRISDSQSEARLLFRICKAELVDNWKEENEYIDDIKLSDKERNLILAGKYCDSDNIEIKARCLDVIRKNNKNFNELSVKASDAYLRLYEIEEHGCMTLIRALTVRGKNNITSDFIEKYISIVCEHKVYPHWLSIIICYLKKLHIVGDWKQKLSMYIDKYLTGENLHCAFHNEVKYYDCKYELGVISKEERDIAIAFANEDYADYKIENREPNTFYMGLDQNYKEALKRVEPYKDKHPEIYKRIECKLRWQQLKVMETMQRCRITIGRVTEQERTMLSEILDKTTINDFVDIVRLLQYIPLPNEKLAKQLDIDINGHQHGLEWGMSKIDDEGNTVGGENPIDAQYLQIHKIIRFKTNYILNGIMHRILQNHVEIKREDIIALLEVCGSKYIDRSRFPLIVEGIYQGFMNEFIVACHLLVPQLEHFLHDVDEKIFDKDLTKLTADKQIEPTLETILNDLAVKDKILFRELSFFFCHGSDVNFRNRLAHGLMSINEMEHEAPYCWWLCFSLFTQIDNMIC